MVTSRARRSKEAPITWRKVVSFNPQSRCSIDTFSFSLPFRLILAITSPLLFLRKKKKESTSSLHSSLEGFENLNFDASLSLLSLVSVSSGNFLCFSESGSDGLDENGIKKSVQFSASNKKARPTSAEKASIGSGRNEQKERKS